MQIPSLLESELISNIIIAIIIILIGFITGKLISKLIQRALHEAEVDNILKKIGIKLSLEKTISSLIKYFIYIAAIIMALNQLSITTVILQIVIGGFIILIILFLILSLKDFIPNSVAGFFIYKNKIIRKGNNIKLKDVEGKVEEINLIETKIKTKSGDMIYIPNSNIIKKELIIKKK